MEIIAGYIVKAIVLPPGINLFGGLLGVLLARRWSRLGIAIAAGAAVTLWSWSTPCVAVWLARSLEHYAVINPVSIGDAQAIVTLGGGRYTDAREYGGNDTVSSDTLERLRYTAKLAKELQLPVAVSGGVVSGTDAVPIGQLMAGVLRAEFQTPVRWVEDTSRNTAENALNLRRILPVQHVVLVTHAIHMPRSVRMFESAGFTVIPAPAGFRSGSELNYGIFDWLPSTSALATSRAVLHEWLGMAYYYLRY
ncbi:MAG: YdcF family protein [Gammaproteobacteria bacterium]|nr:YdcF family protein [Gammaproteobacteria bacterium]